MSQQKKNNTKLHEYRQTVGKQVQATLNSLSKAKQDQTDALGELFNSLKKSILRQIERTYKKFLSVIEERISTLQSSLIQANQQILPDNLDVFTLQNVFRYTKRISSQADKSLMNKFRISIQKLQKSMLHQMKDIEVSQTTKITFNDTMIIQKIKGIEFDSKPLGLDLVNDKLMIWGNDFYNYDSRDKQVKTSEILYLKSIKLYDKDYLLIVHKDYIDIEQPKTGVLIDRINGNFSNVITVVATDDLVYFIKTSCITKLNLNTGNLTTKQIPTRIIENVSKTLYLGCLTASFRFGEIGLFNSNLDLVWIGKYSIQIQKILGIGQYLICCSKSEIQINNLYTPILKKQINIQQICLLNNHSILLLGNQAFILSLITLQMRPIKFKLNKKSISGLISDGTVLSMILSNNEVMMFKIE